MLNKKEVDVNYCCSSFLMYRSIINRNKCFKKDISVKYYTLPTNRTKINDSKDLYFALKKQVEEVAKNKKVALALSGGIDSAILAKFLPEGTMTYTFKCVVPGKKVIDETETAKKYARECNLKNKVIEIYWKDFKKLSPILMKHKGAPIHSIEVQIYKAALQAKKDGYDALIFGESADCLYGGLSNILSKDWTYDEFIERYSFVIPSKVLKNPTLELNPFKKYTKSDGNIDVHGFYSNVFFEESTNSYYNACNVAGIECILPYANTILNVPLNYEIIRSGKNKYLIREIFESLYNGFIIPPKTPMPRPMGEWLKDYKGPKENDIFIENCAENLDGDSKWYIYILEEFLKLNKII